MKHYGSLEQKPEVSLELSNSEFDHEYPFGEREIFQQDGFWKEVRDTYKNGNKGNEKLSRSRAQRKVRANRLLKLFADSHPDEDLLVYMLTEVQKNYKSYVVKQNCYKKYASFVFELAEFTSVLLEIDFNGDKNYEDEFELADGSMTTILHLAAERYLYEVVKVILEYYPDLAGCTAEVGNDDWLPLYFALDFQPGESKTSNCCSWVTSIFKTTEEKDMEDMLTEELKRKDETASMLIKAMDKEQVRNTFQWRSLEPARYFFKDYINHGGMNKTVVAVLDCLMDPDWPFIPKNDDDKREYAAYMPNMPIRYHFYYQVLDGDDQGRPPTDKNGVRVEEFDHSSKTCLSIISEMSENKAFIEHPVVRLLVRRKWDTYGKFWIRLYFALYLLFLVALSVALFIQPENNGHTKYSGWKDYLRLVCEVITLVFTCFYFFSEFIQVKLERRNYFKQASNYFDVGGMILIILIVPFRIAEDHKTEWIISAFAFFINFMRIFKYFPGFQNLGVYSKTIETIIIYDISKFAVIFLITMFSFTGAVFLILKAENNLNQVGGFWKIFLQETRALAEAQGFADDYSNFQTWVVIFLMVNMFCILVILLNILIGQISYRYEEALGSAVVSCDVERTKLITRTESSVFKRFDRRLRYYMEGDFVDNDELADELMNEWLALKDEEKVKKRQEIVQEMVISKLNPPKQEKISLDTPE